MFSPRTKAFEPTPVRPLDRGLEEVLTAANRSPCLFLCCWAEYNSYSLILVLLGTYIVTVFSDV
ncbi:hypothetical protein E2C01_047746 [Portunus trituberculatus]|uniref:Uncharacterized protein n=1 Tax=Portunus trituberculatus TaxID=210409 RepID=A0A5B7GBC7_PORTR|nr:hypothetical protein [Portunus trituberculatus]